MREEDVALEDDEAHKRQIEEMMRSERERYFRDEAIQQEYRDVLERLGSAPTLLTKGVRFAQAQASGIADVPGVFGGDDVPKSESAGTPAAGRAQPIAQPISPRPGSHGRWENGMPPTPTFPGTEEVRRSLEYDQPYGSPSAGYFKAGNAMVRTLPVDDWKKQSPDLTRTRGREVDGPLTPTNRYISDQLHRAWLGSEKSAISTLGFSLPHAVVTPDAKGSLSHHGFYQPPSDFLDPGQVIDRQKSKPEDPYFDRMWFDARYPSALVHESIHRGMRLLNEKIASGDLAEENRRRIQQGQKLLLPGIDLHQIVTDEYGNRHTKDELLARAFMQRLFKDVELAQSGFHADRSPESMSKAEKLAMAQFRAARKYIMLQELDDIEEAAAVLLYKNQRPPGRDGDLPRTPRGPR